MCIVDFSAQEQWLVSKRIFQHFVWKNPLHSTVASEHLLANDDRASLHGTSLGSSQEIMLVFAKLATYAIALAMHIL